MLPRALVLLSFGGWLAGCGATVNVNDGGSGEGGGDAWQPCEGKPCGADCTPCDPSDPSCELPGTTMSCNEAGACVIGDVLCDGGCARDEDCQFGAEWCVGGQCVACDNSGQLCDIDCGLNWGTYERNGCFPCDCAPRSECESDAECGPGGHCYAGALCWDYCGDGDPSCCLGNLCSPAGCSEPPPVGCVVRGCPEGDSCDTFAGCASSGCSCQGGGWACDDDCGGGVCVTPL